MSSEAQSNDTKTRSADVDDNEDLTRAVRSAGNDHDLTTAEDQVSASTATPMDDDEGDHCSPGRPTKLTAGTQAAICARIAAGMAAEHAAECAGVSAATYYGWMADGRRVAARGGDVGHLSEGDKRCLDFVWAVRRAKAESLAEIERAVFDAATGKTPRKKTIHSSKQLANGHGKVCDDDGNPVWVDAVRVEVTDGPDVKALFALMRHRSADLRFDLPPAEMDANAVRCMDDELHLRLAKSIRVRREELGEDEADDRREADRGPTRTAPAVVPLSTDDDGADYAYAWWVSRLLGELAPETPETQGGI